MSSVTPL
jgi:hypothetical protein